MLQGRLACKDEPHKLYVHSKCCAAHWELLYLPASRAYHLVCEKCGKDSGLNIPGIKGHMAPCECEVCSEKRQRHSRVHAS